MNEIEQTVVFLKCLTVEAQKACGGDRIVIDHFPFRVGRESRGGDNNFFTGERRAGNAEPNNDLYLLEKSEVLFVSREHFSIDFDGESYFLIDRRSTLGTWVGGKQVGGERQGGTANLTPGDVIIVGSYKSGFIFQFGVEIEVTVNDPPLLEASRS